MKILSVNLLEIFLSFVIHNRFVIVLFAKRNKPDTHWFVCESNKKEMYPILKQNIITTEASMGWNELKRRDIAMESD